MFILSVIEDEVALHPSQFGPYKHIPAIRSLIESKYVDRVIPDVGLAIALYDIVSIKDAYIFPGDLRDSQGDAACRVVFRLVIFRPKINELVIGRVHSCSQMGIQVSLGFFHDVSVPANLLRQPAVFDERLRTWVWQYQPDGDHSTPSHYPYRQDELICIRIKSVQFTDSLDSSLDATRRAQALSKSSATQPPKPNTAPGEDQETGEHKHVSHVHTEQPPMLVVGSVGEDGLGLVSWWI